MFLGVAAVIVPAAAGDPPPPAFEESVVAEGMARFNNAACGFCHQKGGRKAGKGPKLAGSERADEFLFKRIRNGKPGRMAGFAKTFDDEEIWTIVAYIRSLDDDGS